MPSYRVQNVYNSTVRLNLKLQKKIRSMLRYQVVRLSSGFAQICCRRFSLGSQAFKDTGNKTVLYDFHKHHDGKMVDFAGWCMPVQYKSLGIVASHHHTRNQASLFDVSHMLQTKIYGRDRELFLESLVVGDVKGLASNTGTLSLFTNSSGGIKDDLIINKTEEDYLYVVSNAGCSEKIQAHLQACSEEFKSNGGDVSVEHLDYGLLALQGPSMCSVLQTALNIDLSRLPFMRNAPAKVFGIDGCRVTRCGYTGEDGVEISVPRERTVELAEKLLSHSDVELAGLGARDSLRLEAGLCLYGNDIDESTTPVEASLAWCIGKRRRTEGGFPGAEIILKQLKEKPTRRRIGLTVTGSIARHGATVEDKSGNELGVVTSGCPSPTLLVNIAMAYLPTKWTKVGKEVYVNVRRKKVPATVTKMPFTPARYYFVK